MKREGVSYSLTFLENAGPSTLRHGLDPDPDSKQNFRSWSFFLHSVAFIYLFFVSVECWKNDHSITWSLSLHYAHSS